MVVRASRPTHLKVRSRERERERERVRERQRHGGEGLTSYTPEG